MQMIFEGNDILMQYFPEKRVQDWNHQWSTRTVHSPTVIDNFFVNVFMFVSKKKLFFAWESWNRRTDNMRELLWSLSAITVVGRVDQWTQSSFLFSFECLALCECSSSAQCVEKGRQKDNFINTYFLTHQTFIAYGWSLLPKIVLIRHLRQGKTSKISDENILLLTHCAAPSERWIFHRRPNV